MEDYSLLIKAYHERFNNSNYNNIENLYRVANNLYDCMYQHYDYCISINDIRQQYRVCEIIDQDVLCKLDNAVYLTKNAKLATKIVELRKLFFALSARRNLKNFAFYVEQYKTKKVWDKTYETMKSLFHYTDIFAVSPKLNLLRGSMMPSMGKSYIANLFVAQTLGNDPNAQVLRITYADDLCISTTRQTADIINSRAFREIFPRYKDIPGDKIFKSQTSRMICMCDCEDQYNLNSVTREGQGTGKRAQILIIDDLLKDDSESYNKDLHKKLVNRYDSTWTSRQENDKLKVMLLGTMWADTDLLNVVYDRASEDDVLIPDPNYKWTEVTKNGDSVFIGIPALDENSESTCPQRYSTEALRKRRKQMDRFLWMCVYQQNPIAPEGLDFDYTLLKQYEELPKNLGTRYATLDPARKGKNYVSMPIFAGYKGEKDQYALIDFLYKKKSMKELYDSIVEKIIEHKVKHFAIENNTDTSLGYIIEQKLHKKGYFGCVIDEIYSIKNKEQRIKDNQGYIRGNITYPKKGMYAENTDIAKAMDSLSSYSFNYPTKFDDAIDSVGIFTMEYIDIDINDFPEIDTFER